MSKVPKNPKNQIMKCKYIIFDLFGTITSKRYIPALFGWYLGGKRPDTKMIDGDFEAQIKRLSKSYRLYILSNSNYSFVINSLEKQGLLGYFKVVLVSSEIGARKPSVDAYNKLIDAGADPAKSIFIDDRKSNRVQAKVMGYSIVEFSSKHDLLSKLSEL